MDIEEYKRNLSEPVELPTGQTVRMKKRPSMAHYILMNSLTEEHNKRLAEAAEQAKKEKTLLTIERIKALEAEFGRESMETVMTIASQMKVEPSEEDLPISEMDGLDQSFLVDYVQKGVEQMNSQMGGSGEDKFLAETDKE